MIYVHVPFCRSFCTYCDFYSELCSGKVSQQVQKRLFDDFADGVIDEIAARLRNDSPLDGRIDQIAAQLRNDPPPVGASLEGVSLDGATSDAVSSGVSLDRATSDAVSPQPHSPYSHRAFPPPAPVRTASTDGSDTVQPAQGDSSSTDAPGSVRPTQVCSAHTVGSDTVQPAQVLSSSTDAPDTLYFGGGTPSVLPLDVIEKIVRALGSAHYEEFTIEVNPDDINEKGVEYIQGLVGLGVNRVSMGVQSFDDAILRWMNRRHNAQGARRAVRIIREGGIRNLSIDLIFGLSQLTEEKWRWTIGEALRLKPEHISAYQLSIEEGSALAGLVRQGKYREAPEEQCRKQYDILCEELARAGFVHYEISNWALPGREAIHNSAYWRRVPYIGLGPGAHSLGFYPSRSGTTAIRQESANISQTKSTAILAAYANPPCGSTHNTDAAAADLGSCEHISPRDSDCATIPTPGSGNAHNTDTAAADLGSCEHISPRDSEIKPTSTPGSGNAHNTDAAAADLGSCEHISPRDSDCATISAPSSDSVPKLRSWNRETLARRQPDGSLLRWKQDFETLSASEVSEETVMLALRTAAGIGEAALRQIASSAVVDAMLADGSLVRCADELSIGICIASNRLRIPESRYFVSDDIIARLLP